MATHSMGVTRLNALPEHLLALAMDEFPQPSLVPRASHREDSCRSCRYHRSRFACGGITEEEEGESAQEEERAQRSFLQSLDRLRKCTRGRHWDTCHVCSGTPVQGSLDSSDSV